MEQETIDEIIEFLRSVLSPTAKRILIRVLEQILEGIKND